MFRLSGILSSLALVASCAPSNEPAMNVADESVAIYETPFSLDLISSGTCQLLNGRLRKCVIAPRAFFPTDGEHAVPVRTVVRRVASGNCSTPYALEVTFSAPQLQEERRFQFLNQPPLILRAPGGVPLTEFDARDSSPWTAIATFDPTCAIHVEISVNEPDVDTAEQAQAIVDSIELARQDAVRERDSYQQLVLFHASYVFLKQVAGSLHQEITNDMMQQLRAAQLEALDAFDDLAASPSCADELGGGLDRILDVADALFILGDPSDWTNEDGSTKTLADVFSELAGGGVVAQIETLAAQADPDLEQQYESAYQDAALRVAELEAKAALAREELSPWLDTGGQ
jgi:hypothetical protein